MFIESIETSKISFNVAPAMYAKKNEKNSPNKLVGDGILFETMKNPNNANRPVRRAFQGLPS
jgi:hypothetical protein